MCPKADGMGLEACTVHFELKCPCPSESCTDAMIGDHHLRGVKRKFEESHVETTIDFPYQCQSVFNISMFKLTRSRQNGGDHSLLRSVLICNTLRSIEKEMEREGVRLNCCLNAAFLPPRLDSASNSPADTRDPVPGSASSDNSNTCERERYLSDLDSFSGRMTPLSRTVYDRVDALWNDDTDRLTSLNWSSVLNFNISSSLHPTTSSTMHQPSGETSLHVLMPPVCGTASSCNSSSPTLSCQSSNGGDEIFGDVDLSLYDFDLLSPLSPPNVKLAPVSAEELMRSLSGASENQSLSTSNFCRNELLSDERDRVAPVMS